MSLFWLRPRFLLVVVVVALFSCKTHAVGIDFVTPVGGATWPAGPITVSWKDGGGSPDMSELVSYTLQLMVGGNLPNNSEVLQTIGSANASVATGQVKDIIPAHIAQSVENGFYLRMTSNTTTGNQVINYSDRFTLIAMNGTTDAPYLDGANAAVGISNVPEAQYNVLSLPPSTGDASTGETSTAQASASASTSIMGTSTSTPASTASAQAPASTGLVAGLSLGLLLALIIIVGIVIWALIRWRRQRKRNSKQETAAPVDTVFLGDRVELPASTTSLRSPVELSPTEERYEIDGRDKAVEIGSAAEAVYELEGDWDGWEAAAGRKSQAYDPTR